ncbi:MAG: fibronectin type III domain-containing protein [Gammaproteobacteria bacterium]|nr:fibronectin type III domain-containing protein [Gammaproteobacteria bacterium]
MLPPDEPPPAEVPPAEVENSAPTIHGSPAAAVLYDTLYQFTPEADDADGDVLHFSVTNAPPWATFEPASGKLAGTPRAEYIGATYDDIVISVSDGAAEAQLEGFSIGVQAWADGAIELSWVAPTENTDGSPLTYSVSFMIYWGTESGEYLNEISVPAGLDRYVVEDLVPNTYYFVVTAIGPDGEESEYSEEAYVTVT